YKAKRRAGRALLAAEILSFRELNDSQRKRRHGQGLELALGFYDETGIDAVAVIEDEIIEQIGFSVGGWPWGIQLSLQLIPDDGIWLGASMEWVPERPYQHLDLFDGRVDHRCLVQDLGLLQILGRRLRFRIGVDHANGAPDFFWWTTPQTEAWIARVVSDEATDVIEPHMRRTFNGAVAELVHGLYGLTLNYDPLYNTPDDWGFVDLEADPISVRAVGPMSRQAETHSDVRKTLRRAGNQLDLDMDRVSVSESRAENPGQPYAEYLEGLLQNRMDRRELDVLVVYRGGIDWKRPLSGEYCERILDAADALVQEGVEVVLGFGHGETSVHEIAGRSPSIGVFEAVTPTAAASWVLKEHVNQRLMDGVLDLGQLG